MAHWLLLLAGVSLLARCCSPPAPATRTPTSSGRSRTSTTAPWISCSTTPMTRRRSPSTRSSASIPIRCGRPRRSSCPPTRSTRRAKYDDSIVAADRFIQLHPGHRDVAYAYYLKALDYYVQIADVGARPAGDRAGDDGAGRSGAPLPRQPLRAATRGSRSTSRAIISPARRWRSAAGTSARATISPRSTASSASSTITRRRRMCRRRCIA